jgi:hypothetical protein
MLRITACALIALSFIAAGKTFASSLVSLEPGEREAMLSTCGHLRGEDRSLCRDVVDDSNVIANTKRSCLQAMHLLLQGTAWATVRSMPPAMTCREGLARAGYPVNRIMMRLASASVAQR